MTEQTVGVQAKISLQEAWLRVENPDLSMEEAVEKVRKMGNEIIEIDHENRRIKIYQGEN